MNCIYLKQKLDRSIYCKKKEKLITFKECNCCKLKEYSNNKQLYDKKITKNKTITKLERNRFSILTNDLTKCIVCGNKKEHLHEVFPGRNRSNSMLYGCVIPLCTKCHSEIHKNMELANYYKVLCRKRFNEVYKNLDFIEIFKKNYL